VLAVCLNPGPPACRSMNLDCFGEFPGVYRQERSCDESSTSTTGFQLYCIISQTDGEENHLIYIVVEILTLVTVIIIIIGIGIVILK